MTMTGRREANKLRTREALLQAVYQLVESEGPASLTAERVADAAGISRRTFFNYFESVDALLAAGADDIIRRVQGMLAERPAEENTVDAAFAVIQELFTVDFLDEAARVWMTVEQSPGARRFALESMTDARLRLPQDLLRRRLDPEDADPLRSAVLTTTLLSAFDEARRHWLLRHQGPVDRAAVTALLDDVRRAFDVVRPAFDLA